MPLPFYLRKQKAKIHFHASVKCIKAEQTVLFIIIDEYNAQGMVSYHQLVTSSYGFLEVIFVFAPSDLHTSGIASVTAQITEKLASNCKLLPVCKCLISDLITSPFSFMTR